MQFLSFSLALFSVHFTFIVTFMLPVNCLQGKQLSQSIQRRIPYDLGILSPENDDFVFYDKRSGYSSLSKKYVEIGEKSMQVKSKADPSADVQEKVKLNRLNQGK